MQQSISVWKAAALQLIALTVIVSTANASVVVNEVRPYSGNIKDPSHCWFVLYNAGLGSQSVSGWNAFNDDWLISLPAWVMPRHTYLYVILGTGTNDSDFSDSVATYYAGNRTSFSRNAGEVGLYAGLPSSTTIRDFVGWGHGGSRFGTAYSHAVARGIWLPNNYVDNTGWDLFSYIARIPSGRDRDVPGDWLELGPPYLVPVTHHTPLQLTPVDGRLLMDVTQLVWRSVPGIPSYCLEVDDDSTFATPLIADTVSATSYPVSLGNGHYWWRVSAADTGHYPGAVWEFAKGLSSRTDPVLVDVPQKYQHKDTQLLCIYDADSSKRPGCWESAGPRGPWNGAHSEDEAHIRTCAHCREYCTRAAIQMINAKYGGTLTQDEISYHGCVSLFPGPEGDLGHGVELSPADNDVYSWAMNNAPIGAVSLQGAVIPWQALTTELDNSRPVLTAIHLDPRPTSHDTVQHHYVIINGYEEDPDGDRWIHIMNPVPGEFESGWFAWDRLRVCAYLTLPAGALTGRLTDPNVIADSDVDGVRDFDEQRPRNFESNYRIQDTDGDEVHDWEEIRSYTFHSHCENDTIIFADIDLDNKRAERDCDSDNDGDFDGGEDINGNGINPESGETCEYTAPHVLDIGFFTWPTWPLCVEDVWLVGGTFHANVEYPFEFIADCPIPQNDDPLSCNDRVTTDGNGYICKYLGSFSYGWYRVIVDVLRDATYHEPDNHDPWNCFLAPAHIMLVPEPTPTPPPGAPTPTPWYDSTFTAIGLHYDTFAVMPGGDGPPLDLMQQYPIVVWATGNNWLATITHNDALNLMAYLDGGGKLLLSGQDIGTEIFNSSDPVLMQFYNQYLGAVYLQDVPACSTVSGAGFLAPFQNIGVAGPGGANYPNHSPDEITVIGPNTFPVAQWGPTGMCLPTSGTAGTATENVAAQWRTVYFSFPWESITDLGLRTEIMNLTLTWLYGPAPLPPPVDDLTIQFIGESVELNWSPVPEALYYNVYASTKVPFEPGPETLLASVEETSFVDPDGVEWFARRFYAVTTVSTSKSGEARAALHEWVARQPDLKTLMEGLKQRHIRYRTYNLK